MTNVNFQLKEHCKGLVEMGGFGGDIFSTKDLSYVNMLGQSKKPNNHFVLKPSMSREVRVICYHIDKIHSEQLEFLPSAMQEALDVFTESEVIFILEGTAFTETEGRNNPVTYMTQRAGKAVDKVIRVWDKTQFLKWLDTSMVWLHINVPQYYKVYEKARAEEKEIEEMEKHLTKEEINDRAQRNYINNLFLNKEDGEFVAI